MAEGPYKLPEDWRWVRLGEVFELQQGVSMSPKRRLGINPQPFLRTRNILWGSVDVSGIDQMDFTEDEIENYRLQPGDLLICEGGDVGRTAIWEGQMSVMLYQNHIHRLRRKDTGLEPLFFLYWMQAAYQIFQIYQGMESRTAIPNLSASRLRNFIAPLPPLDEQRRIVARIEELMARVREATRLRQEAKEDAERLWQSALAEVFPRPGAEPPPGWRWVRLGEVVQVKGGKRLPRGTSFSENPTPYPYIRVVDFTDGTVSIESVRYISKEIWEKIAKYTITSDDVYVSIAGSIGKAGIVPSVLNGANLTENAAKLVIKDNLILNKEYLASYLNSPSGQNQIEKLTKVVGQPKLALFRIQQILLPLPPLDEQRRIVAHLEAVQEKVKVLREAQAATDTELQRLEQAILDKAFRGEL